MALTREDLFGRLGLVRRGPNLDEITEKAYEAYELELFNSGQRRPVTSFWGGAFPAGDGPFCGRQAIYELMNIPPAGPNMDPKGRAIVEMGLAAERQIVYRWGRAGLTIGGSVPLQEDWPYEQLRLQDPDIWLSAAIDAVLGLPNWPYVLPVDIKSKSDAAIDEMQSGQRSYDPKHWAQVMCYILLCRKYHDEMGWEEGGFKRSIGGMIYYVSRDNPRKTFEYYLEWNEEKAKEACDFLSQWRSSFLANRLPERPKSWRWTLEPCRWCKMKPLCKQDVKDGMMEIHKSHAAPQGYDFAKVTKMIKDRWNDSKIL